MPSNTVTVFGGSGFVGRQITRLLAEGGARIIVPTRDPERAHFLKPLGSPGQITLVQSSSSSDEAIRAAIGRSQMAVNLVGILYETRRQSFDDVHAGLAGRIARAASEAGLERLVHVSAIGADANAPSAYARSKAAGEAAVREAFPDATILRPSIVVGPGDGFFNRFAAMAVLSPVLPLIGGGHTRFQPVYVGDVARAAGAALERDDARGRTYELGGPGTYTFRELLEYMLQVLGRKRRLVGLPFALAQLQARFLELLPFPPLTRDQVELLKRDNVVSADSSTLDDLGVRPTPIEVVVPQYLTPYVRRQVRVRDA